MSRKIILLTLTLATVSFLLGGCGLVNEPEDSVCPKPSETLNLRFKVSTAVSTTGHGVTRADDQTHQEQNSELPQIEDMVNVNDFAFFIFAGEGYSAPLMCACTNIYESTDPNMNITGSMGSYDVSVYIKKDVLEKYLGKDELDPNSGMLIKFRLVVIANSRARRNATNGNWSSLPMVTLGGEVPATTFGEFMAKAQELTYDLTADFYNQAASSITYKVIGLIPMFGLRQFQVTEAQAYKSRPEERIYLGEINLLRAVSKIRIVDNITRREGDYPRISGAKFTYSSTKGSVLPPDASSYIDGNQVHNDNIPVQTAVTTTVGFLNNPAGYSLDKGDGTSVTIPEWLIYSPEQIIEKGTVPSMEIAVKPSENEDDILFTVPMSGYKDVEFPWTGSTGYLLRNHIYTLQVDAADVGTPLMLTFTAQPWTQNRLTLDYEANPSCKEIIWTPNTYNPGNNNREIFIKPWDSVNNRKAAVGTFTIDTPKGRPWTAFLITTQGSTGSFKFVNADGSLSDTYSGVVGEQATIRVVSTDNKPTQTNSAMLQVIVDMGYGYMEAPIGGSQGNYIISQAAI